MLSSYENYFSVFVKVLRNLNLDSQQNFVLVDFIGFYLDILLK